MKTKLFTALILLSFAFTATAQNAIITPDGATVFCSPGTVGLSATGGTSCSTYSWSTGETTQDISITLDGSSQGAVLDTLSVSVNIINGTLNNYSPTLVLRSIRMPELISSFCPNFNLALSTDSIKAGLVLSYNGVDPDYEFQFVETTTQAVTTATAIQTRWLKLSDASLQVGKFYNVSVRPVIDGTPYCYGNICQIGVASLVGDGNTRIVYDGGEAIAIREGLSINISPNPSNTSFTANIFTADQSPVTVKIFDISNREVSSVQISQGQYNFGSDFKQGIYFVQFSQDTFQQTSKLIKINK